MVEMHNRGLRQNYYNLFPIGTIVTVKREDNGPWDMAP